MQRETDGCRTALGHRCKSKQQTRWTSDISNCRNHVGAKLLFVSKGRSVPTRWESLRLLGLKTMSYVLCYHHHHQHRACEGYPKAVSNGRKHWSSGRSVAQIFQCQYGKRQHLTALPHCHSLSTWSYLNLVACDAPSRLCLDFFFLGPGDIRSSVGYMPGRDRISTPSNCCMSSDYAKNCQCKN